MNNVSLESIPEPPNVMLSSSESGDSCPTRGPLSIVVREREREREGERESDALLCAVFRKVKGVLVNGKVAYVQKRHVYIGFRKIC